MHSKSSFSQTELARFSLLQSSSSSRGGGGGSCAATPSSHYSHSVVLNTFNTPQYNSSLASASSQQPATTCGNGFLPSKLDTDIGSVTGKQFWGANWPDFFLPSDNFRAYIIQLMLCFYALIHWNGKNNHFRFSLFSL
jgi:hypothetical protein